MRSLARFKQQCDSGTGKSCYDYGRALWSTPGAIDKKTAKRYLLRGCELGYRLACDTAKAHNTTTKHHRKITVGPHPDGGTGPCFTSDDLSKAKLTPKEISPSIVHGQRITEIKPLSFWSHVGLIEADVIVRINNLPFNTNQEILQVFASSGKKFGFEVERGGVTITLWYTCN